MQVFLYKDIKSLQSLLEGIAIKNNGGECEAYNYCKFCQEPQCFCRKSETPCADAFLSCGVDHVYCIKTDSSSERKENYRKHVLYGETIVNVEFISKKNEKDLQEKDLQKERSYISNIPVKVGDIVKAPTRYGMKEAQICKVDVPSNEMKYWDVTLGHITEFATDNYAPFEEFSD